jgi:excisionase family DNA binding protein
MPEGLEDTLGKIIRQHVEEALDERLPKYLGQTRLPPRPSGEGKSKWMTIQMVAAEVGRTTRTIRRWIASGRLRTTGHDGRHVTREELERFMSEPRATGDDDDQDVERVVSSIFRKK